MKRVFDNMIAFSTVDVRSDMQQAGGRDDHQFLMNLASHLCILKFGNIYELISGVY